jgi:hypothetical protein
MSDIIEKYLPVEILQKAIISGKEYGWKRPNFKETVDKAVELGLGIIGGQVQFKFPDGICELYWHSYDTVDRKTGEKWRDYCHRTRNECLKQFEKLPSDKELIKEGIDNFDFIRVKNQDHIQLENYLIFILNFTELKTN